MTGEPQPAIAPADSPLLMVGVEVNESEQTAVGEPRIEVIDLRTAGGLGVFLRVGEDQRLTRVAPVRDPNQPRFWCLAAFECSSCGIPVSGAAIWAGFWGSPQSALPGLLATIREDAAAWLSGGECVELREQLLRPRPPVLLPLARAPRRDAAERAAADLDATEKAS